MHVIKGKYIMEMMVTLGMAIAGSSRSPDMLAPAVIPVTAGKKTEKTVQNVWSL